MDEFDQPVPEHIEAGSVEYWKFRARQWQKRCQRAEREKTELISMLNNQRRQEVERREAKRAVLRGDSLGGRSGKPQTPYRP